MDDRETDLYSCQSRYYDPAIGRFLNADAYASTGQGILGNNMFAYCGNNPVNCIDPTGKAFCHYVAYLDDGEGDAPEENVTPIKYPGTISLGGVANVGVGPWIFGVQIFITFDANGYAALQWANYGGMSVGPASDKLSASLAPFVMITEAPGWQALEGPSVQFGATSRSYSVDYVGLMDPNGDNIIYDGFAVSGFATSPDVHVTVGNTETILSVKFDWELFFRITSY